MAPRVGIVGGGGVSQRPVHARANTRSRPPSPCSGVNRLVDCHRSRPLEAPAAL